MTSAFKRNNMRVPFRVHLQRALRVWFILVIVGLIPVLLWLLLQGSPAFLFMGVVESESETIGAVAPARVAAIEVQTGQRVKPGDVLVRLDAPDRNLDLAVQEARLADYQQDVLRYDQSLLGYRQTLLESERRCRQAVQEATVSLEEAKMNRMRDEAELAGLKAEIARLQPLVDKRLVSEIELSSLRPKVQALEQTVSQYAPLFDALQKRCDLANKDLAEVEQRLAGMAREAANDPIKGSVQQAAQSYRQASKNDPFLLRAAHAGVVSRIQCKVGDVVAAGAPILRVTTSSPMYITGLLTQRQLMGLAVGDKLRASFLSGDARQAVTAQIEAIDPEVMDLIDPFNVAPRFPIRGRQVRLRVLEANVALVPGEAVTLEPLRQGSWRESFRRYCFFSGCRPTPL